jgi:hypothetical protein
MSIMHRASLMPAPEHNHFTQQSHVEHNGTMQSQRMIIIGHFQLNNVSIHSECAASTSSNASSSTIHNNGVRHFESANSQQIEDPRLARSWTGAPGTNIEIGDNSHMHSR